MIPPGLDKDTALAAVDLIGRTGATSLNFGFLYDDRPSHLADWWAHAQYRGARISVEHHTGPAEALEALALRLLRGAQCQGCGGLVALSNEGAFAFTASTLLDGRRWDVEDAAATEQCRWERVGPRWEMGCRDAAPGRESSPPDGPRPRVVRRQPKNTSRKNRRNR